MSNCAKCRSCRSCSGAPHGLPVRRLRADVRIEARDLPDLIAYADPRLLARVLDNVLANAVFYNRDAGRIEISGAADDRSDAGTVDTVVITVSDTGSGYPARRVRTRL